MTIKIEVNKDMTLATRGYELSEQSEDGSTDDRTAVADTDSDTTATEP